MFEFKGDNFVGGNSLRLLKDGDQFFPQLVRRIRHAKKEIFIETFILGEDRIGRLLKKALIAAARRGVWISVTVDSWGTFYLSDDYIQELTDAGIVFQIYDPQPHWFNRRPKLFRRLHRKIVVIDNQYAFVGGINLCREHYQGKGDFVKRDYTVEINGPVVTEIRKLCQVYVRESRKGPNLVAGLAAVGGLGDTDVAFVVRDNKRNRSEIEKAYIAAFSRARKRIVIANAYFFPGYRLMRAIRRAAQRGVEVRLILQGDPDIPFALRAARSLYGGLTSDGVKVYEYDVGPLHAKIAIVDDEWSTIGSSNLDPWSLSMNLEANVLIRDRAFNSALHGCLAELSQSSRLVEHSWVRNRGWRSQIRDAVIYHALRHLPRFIDWIPNNPPKIREWRTYVDKEMNNALDRALLDRSPEAKNARRVISKQDYRDVGEV